MCIILAYLLIKGCVQVEHSVFTVHLYFCFDTGCPCKVSPIQPSWEEFQQIGLEEESARRIFHSSQQVPFPLVFDIWSIWYLENIPFSRFLPPNTIFIWYLMFHQHTHQTPFQNLYDFNVPPLPVFPLMHQDKNIQIHLIFP